MNVVIIGFLVPFLGRSGDDVVVLGPSAWRLSVDNPAPSFKSFTMRHTVQRNTSKCLGHLTRESHVLHLPVTSSCSPFCKEVGFAAMRSLEASPVDTNGDSVSASKTSSL